MTPEAAQQLLKACKAAFDEDRFRAFADDMRRYPNEPVMNMVEIHFLELLAAIAEAEAAEQAYPHPEPRLIPLDPSGQALLYTLSVDNTPPHYGDKGV